MPDMQPGPLIVTVLITGAVVTCTASRRVGRAWSAPESPPAASSVPSAPSPWLTGWPVWGGLFGAVGTFAVGEQPTEAWIGLAVLVLPILLALAMTTADSNGDSGAGS